MRSTFWFLEKGLAHASVDLFNAPTHSTGPITSPKKAKAASAQNHFRHGSCAHFRVLEYKKSEAYESLITALD
jgi:hypothetical protein